MAGGGGGGAWAARQILGNGKEEGGRKARTEHVVG